jgi:hypothetical protein
LQASEPRKGFPDFGARRKLARIMSLLNLLHQSVVLKFSDAAQPQYDSTTCYVFRLEGVDAMGFLQLQELRLAPNEEHETIAEPFWINKDLVKEIHDYVSATGKDALKFSGGKAEAAPVKPGVPAPAPKPKRLPKLKAAAL